jgi:membrane protease YdiL (CAAX protease family)
MENFIDFTKKLKYKESFITIVWSDFFILLGALYLIEIPLGVIIKVLIKILGLEVKQIPLPYLKKIILGLVIAPFFEELLMRLYLVFTKKNLIVLLFSCFGFALFFFLKGNDLRFILFIILFLLVGIILIKFIWSKSFIIKYFKYFFYSTAILFGIFHIFNFNGITMMNFFWTPILVLPQIIMGFLFGYIRVTYGLFYSILIHSMVNLPILFTFMN